MPKNTLYIMTGLPYSGKTTLTKALANRFGFKIVSVDEILKVAGKWKKHPTQNEWGMAYLEAIEKVETYLINGKSVIFDEANLTYGKREKLREMARNLKIKTKLIYLKIDKEEILKRWKENAKTKERKQLNEFFLQKAFNLLEEPKLEEKPIVCKQEMDLEDWIKKL